MVFNTEGFTNNSHVYPMTPRALKKPSAIKSLCLFTNILYVKNKTAISQVGSAKSKRKGVKEGTTLWEMKTR